MKKKYLGLSMLFSMLFVAAMVFSIETAQATTTYHICPGSGESCNAEVEVDGKVLKVRSVKTKGGDTVTVEME